MHPCLPFSFIDKLFENWFCILRVPVLCIYIFCVRSIRCCVIPFWRGFLQTIDGFPIIYIAYKGRLVNSSKLNILWSVLNLISALFCLFHLQNLQPACSAGVCHARYDFNFHLSIQNIQNQTINLTQFYKTIENDRCGRSVNHDHTAHLSIIYLLYHSKWKLGRHDTNIPANIDSNVLWCSTTIIQLTWWS